MSLDDKGVFPAWMNDEDIINQLLKKIISEGGRLPYSFVINQAHDTATRERMKKIIIIMQNDRLLLSSVKEFDDLETDIYANRAANLGYRKFKLEQGRKLFFSQPVKVLTALAILSLFFAGLIYLLLHYFKK